MVKDFVSHLFPRVVLRNNMRLSYTLCLGGLAFTAFLSLVVSGTLLLFYYAPTPDGAVGCPPKAVTSEGSRSSIGISAPLARLRSSVL